MESQYARLFRRRLNSYADRLADDLGAVRSLPNATAHSVLQLLLAAACQAQGMEANDLGAWGIRSLPRQWVLQHIEQLVAKTLNLDDDYEFRRLLDVYRNLDDGLVNRLVDRGLASDEEDVRDVARHHRLVTESTPRVKRIRVVMPAFVARKKVAATAWPRMETVP